VSFEERGFARSSAYFENSLHFGISRREEAVMLPVSTFKS